MTFKKSMLIFSLVISTSLLVAQPDKKERETKPQRQSAVNMSPYYDTISHHIVWPSDNYRESIETNDPIRVQRPYDTNSTKARIFDVVNDIYKISNSIPQNNILTTKTRRFAVLNNVSYFSASNGISGTELWRSDGTAAGTYMVKDIVPGANSSYPREIVAANGKIYFSATTPNAGIELWISDGTASGTKLLKDIIPGIVGGWPELMYAVGTTVYFVTFNGQFYDAQLWKTNGTSEGTVLVKDLYTEANDYTKGVTQMTSLNGILFFTAHSYAKGRELWRSDGTESGTYLIKDINPSNNNTYDLGVGGPLYLTANSDKLYFSGTDGTNRKLWVTDGTYNGTNLAPGDNGVSIANGDYNMSANIPFQQIGNTMYIVGSASSTGIELYKYDPTNSSGITLVKDINSGIDFSNMLAINNTLFFIVDNSNDGTYSLWQSKGLESNTQLLKSLPRTEEMVQLTDLSGTLFFLAKDSIHGNELWKSNGTPDLTTIVADISPGNYGSYPYYLTPLNQKLLFNASTLTTGVELWITDGSAAGTSLLKDINQTTTDGSYPAASYSKINLANNILFTAYTEQYGKELYKSDGTEQGTSLIADLSPGEMSTSFYNIITKGTACYFNAISYPSETTRELAIYKTTGTGISKITSPNYNDYDIENIAVADNGLVFYTMINRASITELWRSDGTLSGTYMLHDHVYYPSLVTIGNTVFFSGLSNGELWKSDGTIAGTQLVKNIVPGSFLHSFFAFNNELYFGFRNSQTSLSSFWKSDGTAAGTVKLSEVSPYNYSFVSEAPKYFCVSNNTLYFNGSISGFGTELWKSDGTVAGTKMVKDIYPGGGSSSPYNLIDFNGKLFFTATDNLHGNEPWTSKGDSTNTTFLADVNPGTGSSSIQNWVTAGGKCFFSFGGKLWYSDGSKNAPVSPLIVGNITNITNVYGNGSNLFFSGYEYATGQELYVGDAGKVGLAPKINSASSDAITATNFSITISPNPVISKATLSINGNSENIKVTMADITGKFIYQKVFNNTSLIILPTEKLRSGVYFVIVSNGKDTKSIKIIKQ